MNKQYLEDVGFKCSTIANQIIYEITQQKLNSTFFLKNEIFSATLNGEEAGTGRILATRYSRNAQVIAESVAKIVRAILTTYSVEVDERVSWCASSVVDRLGGSYTTRSSLRKKLVEKLHVLAQEKAKEDAKFIMNVLEKSDKKSEQDT